MDMEISVARRCRLGLCSEGDLARFRVWSLGWRWGGGFLCPATIEREWLKSRGGSGENPFAAGMRSAIEWRRAHGSEPIKEVKRD